MVRRMVLNSEPVSAEHAVHFAERVGLEAGLPKGTIDRLVLAMGEAITNAIHHGNESDPDRLIVVSWTSDESGGWLEVEDEGPGLDAEVVWHASLPEDPTQTNGRGLFLIRTLSDDIETEGGRLRLQFKTRPEEET